MSAFRLEYLTRLISFKLVGAHEQGDILKLLPHLVVHLKLGVHHLDRAVHVALGESFKKHSRQMVALFRQAAS